MREDKDITERGFKVLRSPEANKILNLPPKEKAPSLESFACRTGRHFRVQDLVAHSLSKSSLTSLDNGDGADGDVALASEAQGLKLLNKPQDVQEKRKDLTINLLLRRQNELLERQKKGSS